VGSGPLRGARRGAGDVNVQELARPANNHLPKLKSHDRFGNSIDWLDLDPTHAHCL
jgi:hypothetical protein